MEAEQDLALATFLRKDQAIALIRTFSAHLVDVTFELTRDFQPILADLAQRSDNLGGVVIRQLLDKRVDRSCAGRAPVLPPPTLHCLFGGHVSASTLARTNATPRQDDRLEAR